MSSSQTTPSAKEQIMLPTKRLVESLDKVSELLSKKKLCQAVKTKKMTPENIKEANVSQSYESTMAQTLLDMQFGSTRKLRKLKGKIKDVPYSRPSPPLGQSKKAKEARF